MPTQIVIRDCQIFGPRIKGWEYGVVISAGEDVSISRCYLGNARSTNLYINQTADDSPILEVKVCDGTYIDGAGTNSVAINGSAGSGASYIGQVKFIGCDIKGQGGDSVHGIYVDGTVRPGAYAQAMRGLHISDCTISGMKNSAIVLQGNHIVIVGNDIKGNNYFNNSDANAVVIGSQCEDVLIEGNLSGGSPEGVGNSLSPYAIEIQLGAKEFYILNNVLRNNAVDAILDGSAEAGTNLKRIEGNAGFNENRPAVSPALSPSSVDFVNPYGSPATVSIYNGTVSDIKLNGTTIVSATNIILQIGPGDKINLTYTVAPSWIWWLR